MIKRKNFLTKMQRMRSLTKANKPIASSLRRSYFVSPVKSTNDPIDENAASAYSKSCYRNIDWKIDRESTCDEAIKRMTVGRIGCLAVTDKGKVVGVVSERDFINKVAFPAKTPQSVKVSDICTYGASNLVSVKLADPIDLCMQKMLGRDIRHLLVTEDNSDDVIGMISIKDVVKCTLARTEAKMERLELFVQTQDMMKYQI